MIELDFWAEQKVKYPLLYREQPALECWDGWNAILDKLGSRLEPLITAWKPWDDDPHTESYRPYCIQVKEKFGTLRFYMSSSNEEMDEWIDLAEVNSSQICEMCGKPGELQNHVAWFRTTRCRECLVSRTARESK